MYYFTFIYLLLLISFSKKLPDKYRFLLAAAPLIVIALVRYGVGADYFAYRYFFDYLDLGNLSSIFNFSDSVEPGFKLILYVVRFTKISSHLFVALISTITIVVTLKWIESTTTNFEMSVFLQYTMMYLYWNLSALRQGLVLSVLMYIFFNGKKQFTTKAKVIWTLIMFSIHITAIIVPMIYLISLLKWNKKSLFILLLLAPLTRILFGQYLIDFLTAIPLLSKVSRYIDYNSISLLSMPSIMRGSFIILILLHYDALVSKFADKVIQIKFSLLGLIAYFYLPISMVVGTRTTIFSFSLLVIILPYIASLYSTKKYYILASTVVILIGSLSFVNELSKLMARTGYLRSEWDLNFSTIFNKNIDDFNGIFATEYQFELISEKMEQSNQYIYERSSDFYLSPEVPYSADNQHFSVKFGSNNLYGIINQKGEVVVQPYFVYPPDVFKNYAVIRDGNMSLSQESYFVMDILKELTEENLVPMSFIKDVIKDELYLQYYSKKGTTMMLNYPEISVLNNFDFLTIYGKEKFDSVSKVNYKNATNYEYYKLLSGTRQYQFVTKNSKPLINKLYKDIIPLNEKGIIIGISHNIREYINSDGNIIWVEYIN